MRCQTPFYVELLLANIADEFIFLGRCMASDVVIQTLLFIEYFTTRWADVFLAIFRMVANLVLSERSFIGEKFSANVTTREKNYRSFDISMLQRKCLFNTHQYSKSLRCIRLTCFTNLCNPLNESGQIEHVTCSDAIEWCWMKWCSIFNVFVNCSPHSQQFHERFFQDGFELWPSTLSVGSVPLGMSSFSSVMRSGSASKSSTIWWDFDEFSSDSSYLISGNVECCSKTMLAIDFKSNCLILSDLLSFSDEFNFLWDLLLARLPSFTASWTEFVANSLCNMSCAWCTLSANVQALSSRCIQLSQAFWGRSSSILNSNWQQRNNFFLMDRRRSLIGVKFSKGIRNAQRRQKSVIILNSILTCEWISTLMTVVQSNNVNITKLK